VARARRGRSACGCRTDAAGLRLEPLLEAISSSLTASIDDERVRGDLVRGLKKPLQGRRGLTRRRCCARCLDARQELGLPRAAERIADGLTLRQFTDFYCDGCPSMTPSTAASIG